MNASSRPSPSVSPLALGTLGPDGNSSSSVMSASTKFIDPAIGPWKMATLWAQVTSKSVYPSA